MSGDMKEALIAVGTIFFLVIGAIGIAVISTKLFDIWLPDTRSTHEKFCDSIKNSGSKMEKRAYIERCSK